MGKVAMINKQILFIFKIFKDKTKDEILDKLNILINLNPGMFDFPFKFKIPDNLQPSFEYPLDSHSHFIQI